MTFASALQTRRSSLSGRGQDHSATWAALEAILAAKCVFYIGRSVPRRTILRRACLDRHELNVMIRTGLTEVRLNDPRDWKNATLEQFIKEVDGYIRWYNEKRIKISLGARSPIEYRESLGLRT